MNQVQVGLTWKSVLRGKFCGVNVHCGKEVKMFDWFKIVVEGTLYVVEWSVVTEPPPVTLGPSALSPTDPSAVSLKLLLYSDSYEVVVGGSVNSRLTKSEVMRENLFGGASARPGAATTNWF